VLLRVDETTYEPVRDFFKTRGGKPMGADHPMEAHKIDSRAIAFMGESADAQEGVQSFLEKRPPQFKLSPSKDRPAFYPWWNERPFK